MTDNDLIKFNLSAEFVIERAAPTAAELAYGFEHGWIGNRDVVKLAELELSLGIQTAPIIAGLALLLRDEYCRIPEILAGAGVDQGEAWRLWLFLALAWLSDNRAQFADPYEVIEMIYADFDYPDEISGLVRFMPVSDGEVLGISAIDRRWEAYLSTRTRVYTQRSLEM